MKRVLLIEHQRYPRAELTRAGERLQEFDERQAASSGETIFDWSLRKEIRAKNYVGVVQVPGVCVEILPKIDAHATGEEAVSRAQTNLLYMLAMTRRIPARAREVAALGAQRRPLLEALIAAFAERLLRELRRGLIHDYVTVEENSPCFKGKLLVSQHVQRNHVHQERAFVAFDEFLADTNLNRILKATCRLLARSTTAPWTERCLREAILHLADVEEIALRPHLFERVHLNRNSERFAELLGFCRLVCSGLSPAPQVGETPSFSLLFPMDRLFEEFIGEMILRHSGVLCPPGARVRLQGRGSQLWLLRRENGDGVFRLKPDVLVEVPAGNTRLVLDTKWKRLKSDAEDSRNGVSLADVYQLYAYVQRYSCREAVLLYPRVPGATGKTYTLDNDSDRRIRIAFIDMGRDMSKDSSGLLQDLRVALGFGAGTQEPPRTSPDTATA